MNTTFTIASVSEAIAANQAPTITSVVTRPEKSTIEAMLKRMRPSLRLAAVILQGGAGILAALYLLGAGAFGAALLFYTLNRCSRQPADPQLGIRVRQTVVPQFRNRERALKSLCAQIGANNDTKRMLSDAARRSLSQMLIVPIILRPT
jgi:hypothetical protein